ncbi:MAG TPA: uL15 family ribosomal protein [Candidatus Methanomethylophilaceae archaeon]|nr:uL15 family ribosomal protein [Candidatus Methanomethylophilaceae archaeon]
MPSRTKKMRGSRTHGRGAKAGRGAGLTGGRGMAGLSKTGKMRMIKYFPDHFGRHGFKRPQSQVKANITINVSELQEALEEFVTKGFAKKEGDAYCVNLGQAGITKLLGNGNIDVPVNVTVAHSSEKARLKIEASGGSVAE